MTELWSAARIATEYDWAPATARSFIRRYGLKHVTTEGPRDTRLYDPDEVRAAKASMPGRGNYRPKGQLCGVGAVGFLIAAMVNLLL